MITIAPRGCPSGRASRRARGPPLVRAAETIAEHFDGIVAYVEVGLTNAITEGLNRKARVVTSRSYGFRRLASFASMLLLCCGGITLPWPHVVPL